MPYALSNLVEGERPSARAVRVGYQPATGEVVVADAEWEDLAKRDWVWDATNLRIRAPTAADLLRIAKRQKEIDLRDDHNAWINANLRTAELVIVSNKDAKGTAMTPEETQIRDTASSQYTRLKNLITQTRNATTVAQVEAIVW